VHLLMFADDIVIVADTPQLLQRKINTAQSFCEEMGLMVHANKTQMVIFGKRKPDKSRYTFTWAKTPLEIVDSYNYLGVRFYSNGLFSETAQGFASKATVASSEVWNICKKSRVPPITTHLKLFDSLVKSTLLYASPVWGLRHEDILERAQNGFLKKLKVCLNALQDTFYELKWTFPKSN